ncbi:MAG: hypothetical protein KIT10_05735 [Flavobacteriales bacterium]|nr:hypothetical protein [Flavobacteriales bacterium]
MKTLSTIALFCGAVLLSSCTKEGPEGPAGPQGPQGNANVQSLTFSASPGDWSSISGGYAINRNVPIVTSGIASTGAVLVYLQSGSQWVAIPLTISGVTWLYGYGTGQVQIEVNSAAAPSQVTVWKVVAIASSGMITDSGVDVTNYDEVRDYFGLEE